MLGKKHQVGRAERERDFTEPFRISDSDLKVHRRVPLVCPASVVALMLINIITPVLVGTSTQ
eukprot:1494730-Rhodomonas_salina.1